MSTTDELMKLADEAIHAYAAWLAESITINEPRNHPDILNWLNEKKDAARRKLEAAIRATCGVLVDGLHVKSESSPLYSGEGGQQDGGDAPIPDPAQGGE